ncbi:hypothetical protein BC827DRAFT_1162583 [Russula dissimulans]|nr:hypothetical protein BC827DRAFT_1162583 [Russula dissimulans]
MDLSHELTDSKRPLRCNITTLAPSAHLRNSVWAKSGRRDSLHDLTLPQLILGSSHPTCSIRKDGTPWLVDDSTGRRMGFEEVSRGRTTRSRRFT